MKTLLHNWKIYLDTCCLSRPFNDQTPIRIRQETEAVEIILKNFSTGDWSWIVSGALTLEVDNNPEVTQRDEMKFQMADAYINVSISEIEIARGRYLEKLGFKQLDALHLACAERGNADVSSQQMTGSSEGRKGSVPNCVSASKTLMNGYGQERIKMDVLKIADNEVYKLGIEALAGKLGVAGVSRFLKQIQPLLTSDYSIERHEWLDSLPDMDTLIEQIRQAGKDAEAERNRISKLKTYISKDGKPLATRIREISDEDLYKPGLEALVDKLSIAGMPRFIRLCAPGTGPYAIDKHKPLKLDSVPTSQKVKNEHSMDKK